MDEEYRRYEGLLEEEEEARSRGGESSTTVNLPAAAARRRRRSAEAYNRHRASALQARWELIVHRQAVGFTVNNHGYVLESYPIPDALPVGDGERRRGGADEGSSSEKKLTSKELPGQLDWWQRVGRWR